MGSLRFQASAVTRRGRKGTILEFNSLHLLLAMGVGLGGDASLPREGGVGKAPVSGDGSGGQITAKLL